MIFLTIPDINGQTITINPNQISLIMESPKNNEFWIVLGKHSIEITDEIYSDVLRHLDRVTIDVAEPQPETDISHMRCDELELAVRPANVLKNNNIYYVSDLVKMTFVDLLKLKNMGRKAVRQIQEALQDHNLKLKGDQ
jgi:DNA-directed RNA polymerase alpha subunit